jgi:hypothetical protein
MDNKQEQYLLHILQDVLEEHLLYLNLVLGEVEQIVNFPLNVTLDFNVQIIYVKLQLVPYLHTIHGLHVAMDNKQELLLLHRLLVVPEEHLLYLNLVLLELGEIALQRLNAIQVFIVNLQLENVLTPTMNILHVATINVF